MRHEPEMTRESRTKQEVHAHRSLPTKKAIMMLPFSACKLFTIVSFITSLSYGSSFTFLHSASWRLAQFSLPTFLPHTQKSVRRTTSINSSENDSEEPKLILGDQIKQKLNEMKSKYPTSESAYLEAARQRAEEYKRKKELGLLEEDRTAESLPGGEGSSVNYGPKDLSGYDVLFKNEGWEASLKENDMASLIGGPEEPKKEEEGQSLILFDTKSEGDDQILLL